MLLRISSLFLAAHLAILSSLRADTPKAEDKNPPPAAGVDRNGDPLPPGAVARFGSFRGREGASNHVRAVYSPGRHLLATGGHDSQIHLFDLASGKRLRSLAIDDSIAGPMALSPDGTVLAVESRADVCLFDTATGKPLRKLKGHSSRLDALTFSPDGRTLASVEGKDSIRLWDPATGQLRHSFPASEGYHRFACFSPDSQTLAVVCELDDTDRVRIWDVASGEEKKALATSTSFGTLAFSPDGKTLATLGDDLRLWDLDSHKRLLQKRFPDLKIRNRRLGQVVFSPDGTRLAVAVGEALYLLDPTSGQGDIFPALTEGFGASEGKTPISCLAFTRDGKKLVSWAAEDRARVRDVASGKETLILEGHQGSVHSLLLSAEGKRIISEAEGDRLRLWELATGKEAPLPGLPSDQRVAALSPDGRMLAASRLVDRTIRLWDVAADKELRRLELPAGQLTFSPDSKLLAASSPPGRRLNLWQADSGKELPPIWYKQAPSRNPRPGLLAFAPDSQTVAFVDDGQIRLCEVATGRLLRTFEPGEGNACANVVFSPDGHLLASGIAGDTIRIWHTGSGQPLLTLETQRGGDVRCLAFSADGRTLASGGEHNEVRLWEVASGQLRHEFSGHASWVEAVLFSADGRYLISGSRDWTALVWDLTAPGAGPVAKLAELWQDLGGTDAPRAYRAVCQLLRQPGAVPFLKDQLKETLARGGPPVDRLIKQLDSDSFEEREQASAQLETLGKDVEDSLRRALASNPSPEVRARLERLLEGLRKATPSPERLRHIRVVETLERIGSAEAQDLLRALAQGTSAPWLTEQARLSLQRLGRK